MSRTSRRQDNAGSSVSVIQVGANSIFKPAGCINLLPVVRTAVTLSHQILVEGHMLASLHVLRLLQNNQPLPRLCTGGSESKWQTMMDNCYAAVSQAVGPRCQQFSPNKEPELATSYNLYQHSLPAGHIKPERPTWLKPVSLSWLSNPSQAAFYPPRCIGGLALPQCWTLQNAQTDHERVCVPVWNKSCTQTPLASTKGHVYAYTSVFLHSSRCHMWHGTAQHSTTDADTCLLSCIGAKRSFIHGTDTRMQSRVCALPQQNQEMDQLPAAPEPVL